MSKKKKKARAVVPSRVRPNQAENRWVFSFLIVSILAVYGSVSGHQSVALDDDGYVMQNPMVQAGLTWSGIKWAFTTLTNSNWHPLTWLSHMTDCELYGLQVGHHLMTNVFFHFLASLFLFLAIQQMTENRWPSAMVAALFALHPLHVESVAWLAERKDVLSGFLCMLTLWFYARYVRAPDSGKRYRPVLICYALGLMAKPMLVTLPFLLLLLDYWPLKRFNKESVREKWPLFVLSAASCAITYFAQMKSGAVKTLELFPLRVRLGNAALSYVRYLTKTIWPVDLAVFYPLHPPPALWVAVSLVVLIAITAVAILLRRNHPWLLTGWFWYGGSLVPVIGIIQVGEQGMADRYTYIPLVGIFIAVVWEIHAQVGQRERLQKAAAALGVLCLLVLGFAAHSQVQVWKNSKTLFEHALAVTTGNSFIENNLGYALGMEGNTAEALSHYEKGIQLSPQDPMIHYNLGVALIQEGRMQEALVSFNNVLRLNPENFSAHLNAGFVLVKLGRMQEAAAHFREAVRLDPSRPEAHNSLGQALADLGMFQEAEQQFARTVELQPTNESAQRNLQKMREILAGR